MFTQSDLELYAAQGQGHGVDWSIKNSYTEPYTRAVDKGLFTTSCPEYNGQEVVTKLSSHTSRLTTCRLCPTTLLPSVQF